MKQSLPQKYVCYMDGKKLDIRDLVHLNKDDPPITVYYNKKRGLYVKRQC